jgi:flavin reductase (DIM6/NTAB) family NADH-FMN oxidoreductase RutF
VNRNKTPNVAPKSWISMIALKPAIIGFGCNLKHQTAKNVLETGGICDKRSKRGFG